MMFAALPLIGFSGGYMGYAMSQASGDIKDGYAKSSAVAEEVAFKILLLM